MSEIIFQQDVIQFIRHQTWLTSATKAQLIAGITQLPSAQPEWIPCSERMPEIAKDVLTTYIDGETKRRHVREDAWLPDENSEKGGWCNEEYDYRYNGLNMEVVAWMPMPEPYKEG